MIIHEKKSLVDSLKHQRWASPSAKQAPIFCLDCWDCFLSSIHSLCSSWEKSFCPLNNGSSKPHWKPTKKSIDRNLSPNLCRQDLLSNPSLGLYWPWPYFWNPQSQSGWYTPQNQSSLCSYRASRQAFEHFLGCWKHDTLRDSWKNWNKSTFQES